MKMETVIYAKHSGVVKGVEVNIGDNVETKDLLITIK